jgi:putative ABC transport system permease protein
LHHRVEPLLIGAPGDFRVYVAIMLNTSDVRQSVEDIREVWRSAMPDMAFDYFFLDDDFDRQYRVEDRFGLLSSVFSSLAAFIAGMGLFGLASDAAQRRMKEVSIRKVLGASVAQVWMLLSNDFLKLILVSTALSAPLAYYGLIQWLSTFPVRTTVDAVDFLFAFDVLLAVGLTTISYHVTRAALSDPSEVLRKE